MKQIALAAPKTLGLWVHRTETALGHLHEIQAMGFDYLAVKVADGRSSFDPTPLPQLLADAASIDLPVVPWAYVYPEDADAAGIAAIVKAIPAGAEHLILDAEGEWETGGSAALAHTLCHGIAEATGHAVNLWLSSFYPPLLHPQFPYVAFLAHCAGFMPQSYIEGNTPASLVVSRTMAQAYTLAAQADIAFVPTVNNPALLPLLWAKDVHAANVWLWDGAPGSDAGVSGHEASWQPEITAFKA